MQRRVAEKIRDVRKLNGTANIPKATVTPKKHSYRTRNNIIVVDVEESDNSDSEKSAKTQKSNARSNATTDASDDKQNNTNIARRDVNNNQDVKCGMCPRAQVKDFCHSIPGCGNEDLLCMVCYPRWLTVWHKQSKDKKKLPCPICRQGTVSWDKAVAPYQNDFIIMSLLQE